MYKKNCTWMIFPPPSSWQDMLALGTSRVAGATMAWRKEVFDVFGSIPSDPLGEDAFIPFRCALLGGMTYTSDALVQYRSHSGNVSFWKALEGGKRSDVGKEVYLHALRMLKAWEDDIHVAHQHSFLSQGDHIQALSMCREQQDLLQCLLESMNQPLLKACYLFLGRRKRYQSLPSSLRLLFEGYLVYKHINIYRLLHFHQGVMKYIRKLLHQG